MQVVRERFSLLKLVSGVRVSNAWVIYLRIGDNVAKVTLIPDNIIETLVFMIKDGLSLEAIVWR